MSRITEKIGSLGLWFITGGLFLTAVILLGTCGLPGLFMALPPLTVAGILFWRLTSNAVGEGFIHFFLAPHDRLAAPPVSLTPIYSMLASGRDADAEAALLPLLESHPEIPEITLLLLGIYDRAARHAEGAALAQRYFSSPERVPGDAGYDILMLGCDHLLALGQAGTAIDLLRHESALPCYSARQLAGISRRLAFFSR